MGRKKTYRFKDPVKHVKSAIGEFQTKHPFLSLVIEAPIVIGAGAGVLEAIGFPAFSVLSPVRKVPVAGKIYTNIADGVAGLF